MRCISFLKIFLLLASSLALTSVAFWDDLADAVEDIVDENLGDNSELDLGAGEEILNDILDEAKEFLDAPSGILPGGNIGGDENSIFNEGFTPIETGTSGESDDLDSLLDDLERIANQIGQLLDGGDSLSDDDIQTVLESILDRDEVLEFFLTATLEYILEDFEVELGDEFGVDKLVPLLADVYNVVKDHRMNRTALEDLEERELVLNIFDAVMNNLFPNMTIGDIFCQAATDGVERLLEQSSTIEREAPKSIIRNLALLVLGCEEQVIDQRDPGRRLRAMFSTLLNESLWLQNLNLSSDTISNNLMNANLSSVFANLLDGYPLLQFIIQNSNSSNSMFPGGLMNETQRNRNQNLRDNIFQTFGRERNILDLFRGRRGDQSTQTTPTDLPEKSTTLEGSTSTSTKNLSTIMQFTTPTTRPTVTTTKTTPTTTTQIPTATTSTNRATSTATTTSKFTQTSTAQPTTLRTTATTTTTSSSTSRSFPFLPRRNRTGELRGEIREAVTNATERLIGLIREEIRDSRLAQLLYTLLNSDLVRQILQTLDIPLIPTQKTTMKMPTAETTALASGSDSEDLFSDTDAIIQRIPSDVEPEVRAMAQTTIQVLQTANLSDPESIVSTVGQVLLDNVRQTIQDEILSNPLELVRDIVDFVTRNDSIVSRIVPQDTITSINDIVGPALQATEFTSRLTQLYSSSDLYGTSQRCSAERAAVGEGITQAQTWALTFLDSMGKLGTGFLQGNTWLEGNFDACQDIYGLTDTGDVIQGQYVKMRVRVRIPGLTVPDSSDLTSQETGLPNILWHVCLPKGCNSDDITKIGDTIADGAGTIIESVDATILEKRDPGSEPAFIVAVVVLSSLGLLCLIGTAVDVATTNQKQENNTLSSAPRPTGSRADERRSRSRKSKNSRETAYDGELPSPTGEKMIRRVTFQELRADIHGEDQGYDQPDAMATPPISVKTQQNKSNGIAKFFMAFSVYTNSRDVMKAAHAPGDLSCLHGIRVISILWVILGHVHYFAPQFGNIIAFVEMSKWWTFHAILNAPYAVDTFFTISGCLVSYLFLRTVKKAGGLKVAHMVMYYVHRYLRLTPLYALAILIYHGVTPYIEDGPFLAENTDRGKNCEDLWWTNLLYFSSLRFDVKQCMGWSWYLPNDMQFYAAAPLILVPLALGYKYLGLLVAFLQVALHLIMYAVMVEKYDASLIRDTRDFFIHLYIKPYTRCGPYAIGLALGYLLFKTKGKFKMPKVLVALGWLLAVGGGLTLTYITHDNLKQFGILRPTWSDNQMNALDIVAKPLWSLCVAWVILACVNGYGGVVNSFLSWTAWIPLSRLTFGTYLIHPMVLYYFNNNRRTVLYLTYHFVIERFLSTALLSFVISYVLSLLIETPVRNLTKPARKTNKPESKSDTKGLSTRIRQDQDKKSNKIPLSNIDKLSQSKAEGLRSRNIYLPKKHTTPAHEQSPSLPEPAFPVSAGSGLYPTVLSEAQEDTYSNTEAKATRRSSKGKVVYETISKTASFDDEEPDSDFPNLLSQPASPEPIQERPSLTNDEFPARDFEARSSKPTSRSNLFERDIREDVNDVTDPIPSRNENTPTDEEKTEQYTPMYPSAAQFSIETSVENVPSGIYPLEVNGVVNEAYEHDNADDLDIVLPSAPPETPESDRSQTSRKAVTSLA